MKIIFNISYHTSRGQKLSLIGSVPQLGSWIPSLAVDMNYTGGGNWQLQVDIPKEITCIEYKYILTINNTQIFEEWDKKHRVCLDGKSDCYRLYDCWQVRPDNLAFYSSAFTKSIFARSGESHPHAVYSGRKYCLKVMAPRVEKYQSIGITGNQAALGDWNPERSPLLCCNESPEWYIELDANEVSIPFEYKFFVWDNNHRQLAYWESGENRKEDRAIANSGESVIVNGMAFKDDIPPWKCAGTVIPVFSLRSSGSFGVGDLGDLRLFIDWIKKTHQRIIQVLPMNDTTNTHTWLDSYPYSSISVYALHPMYIDLAAMGELNDEQRAAWYKDKQKELNSKDFVDYEEVNRCKLSYCREYFEQEQGSLLKQETFNTFIAKNEEWLMPYAAYCYLRDKNKTADFERWGQYAVYDEVSVKKLAGRKSEAYREILFSYYLQYVLHTQFKAVSGYARRQGVVLKGDLPIGVNRTSVEVWKEPGYFNMEGQAGAPPDDFSAIGQNWRFPTYNWEVMEKDGFAWWKSRFKKMDEYFDCFRIDHILGFFRIWEIPVEYTQGLCGHFNPALPLSKEDMERYGFRLDEARFTKPRINKRFIPELFGEYAATATTAYLMQPDSDSFVLKPVCDTQQKIRRIFEGKNDKASAKIQEGLCMIANEVLFIQDPHEPSKYHPRISADRSYVYQELEPSARKAFDHLYWDFFYHRHEGFWKARAYKKLIPLATSTEMLICGEDLGMIPQSVPEVMGNLRILSLEIERMPKSPNSEFADLLSLPYYSVCTTSTHDMPPLRNWWKEDKQKTQRYYNFILQRHGEPPEDCTAELAMQIIGNHLAASSMLALVPLQDWFAIEDSVKRLDIGDERINIPAISDHYWRYRMHISLEELMASDKLNNKIIALISSAGRR